MSETTDVERTSDTTCGRASLAGALTLNDYQRQLHTYKPGNYACHALGLVGELAEVQDELKKDARWLSIDRDAIRDMLIAAGRVADRVKKQEFHGTDRASSTAICKELGDVLWYITAVAGDYGLSLEEVARANIAKLRERYPNGFVKGGGVRDERTFDVPAPKYAVSVNLRTAAEPTLPLAPSRPAHCVAFVCGCRETTEADGTRQRTYCPNGECRRLAR